MFRQLVTLGLFLVACRAECDADSATCAANEEEQTKSPAMMQVRAKPAKSSHKFSGHADAKIHGTKVTRYNRAFRAGKAPHEKQDYNIGDDDPVTWIVIFKDECSDDDLKKFCSLAEEKGASNCNAGHPDEGGIEEASFVSSKATLEDILKEEYPCVEEVEADEMEHMDLWSVGEESTKASRSGVPWGLDRVDQAALPLSNGYSSPGNQGEGVHVYIADTGIRNTHHDFGGRSLPTYDAYGNPQVCDQSNIESTCSIDNHFHGTHCAGSVAGTTYGVAPKATLHAVKVLSDQGSGSRAGIMEALDWVGVNHPQSWGRGVLSMSLGGNGVSPAYTTTFNTLINKGIVVVVAAGNENTDACTKSPAFSPPAITVGSTDSRDARSGFSNYGTCIDIFAPGSSILSCDKVSDTATRTASGTSMACPHVSGGAAVALSNFGDLTAAEMSEYLTLTASSDVVTDAKAGSPNKFLRTTLDMPAPTPVPPPTPAPPPGWSLEGTGCEYVADEDCYQSRNYPSNYGNNQACEIVVSGTITVQANSNFKTEGTYDKITIRTSRRRVVVNTYHGEPPANLHNLGGAISDNIIWSSDYSEVKTGWKICRTDGGGGGSPTNPPTNPPYVPTNPPTNPPYVPTNPPTNPPYVPTNPPTNPPYVPTNPPTNPPYVPTNPPTNAPTNPPSDEPPCQPGADGPAGPPGPPGPVGPPR